LVGLTLVILLAVLLTGGWLVMRSFVRKVVDGHLATVATTRRDMVQARVTQLLQRVELNTDRGEMRGFLYELSLGEDSTKNRDASQVSLDRMANGKPIVAAALADANGTVLLSTRSIHLGRDVSGWGDFKAGSSGPHFGAPRQIGNRFEATLTAPIRTRSEPNRVYGVLFLIADVTALATDLGNVTGLGQTGEVLLGVREGPQLRFLFPPRNAPRTEMVPVSAAPALASATQGREAFFRTPDYRGTPVLAAGRPLNYGGWGLVVKMDEQEAYAPLARVLRYGVILGLLIAAVGLAAAYMLARSFLRPVRRLAQAAARIAGGDYETQVPVRSRDELGALSLSFNEMTAAIRARGAERDRAEQALREADRRKDEFLAMLGHELRNPLSAIANAVRLWREAAPEPEITEMAQLVIERQTANLSRHVDDLLDVVRISEGKIELRRQPVEAAELIARAVEVVRGLLDEKGHTLDLHLAEGSRGCIDADPTRIEQVLTNLLINAAKYTPDGGHITVAEKRSGDDVVITVTDNGMGIAPDVLPEIFELFTQGDRSLERTTGGLGIGLNLCRQLVELHGGSISAHSAGRGCGAEFTVRLPAVAAVPQPRSNPVEQQTVPKAGGRRILLVDDNKDTLRLLSRLLIRRGYEVSTVDDGLAALRVAQEFQPEILLLDIGLPGLDGYSLARRLRADGFADTPMIAISGYAQENDRALAREAGFNHHFAKPVDVDALAALLSSVPARVAE
jgi:signal transduction histidine kinase/ActR/RegA family two-component response regulator